jgi:tRNA U34 5-methylaminomethyl-2-thiouridine-forming methyltransferase MnmC
LQDFKLKNYDIVPTDDGSFTVFSHHYGEACHSTSGAVEETIKHYIQGCDIAGKIPNHNPLRVLEVGFGIGIGLQQTLQVMKKHPLHFLSMEIDEELILYLSQKLPELKGITKIVNEEDYKLYELKRDNLHLQILVGDARVTLPRYLKDAHLFHAIYQDAFSPKRNAILWTKEWFELLKSASHRDVIMSTYSSSSSIRKAMIAAGWRVRKGDKFGPKRSSTRAYLQGESDQDIQEHLERSPAPMLTDKNATEYTIGNTHEKK